MSTKRIVPDITTNQIDECRGFYTKVIGLEVAMDMDWAVTLKSPTNETAQITLLKPPTAPVAVPDLSIEVEDVDSVHAKAIAQGLEIVYPLTDEPWGVRRFFVADPSGKIVNVLSHAGG